MYPAKDPNFQGRIIALTVNYVNHEGVNLTLFVNHYNGESGAVRDYLKDIFLSTSVGPASQYTDNSLIMMKSKTSI